MREADLERHLTNSQESDTKAATTAKPAPAKPQPQPKHEGGDTTKPKMLEFGSKEDYQLNQAIALLKGMSILQRK
jgi:carboxyl-terminal processing protease